MIEASLDLSKLKGTKAFLSAVWKDSGYISSLALNATTYGLNSIKGSKKRNLNTILAEKSKSFLDQPKRVVQKGWYPKERSTKRSLVAGLDFKDRPVDTYRYLYPHIRGVERKRKGYEYRLADHPLSYGLPPNSVLVPNADNFIGKLKIDRYGNVSRSTIKYIYQNVASTTRSSQRASVKTGKTTSEPTFLIGKPLHKNRPPGVWWRRFHNEKLLMIFEAKDKADYQPKYLVDNCVKIAVDLKWHRNLDLAMRKVTDEKLIRFR